MVPQLEKTRDMIKNVTLTIHIRCEYSPVMFSGTAPMTSLYVIIIIITIIICL